MSIHIALYQPEIPPNTGNIIRLCANCGVQLHLIHPLGFSLNEKACRRAGLDYHEWAHVIEHSSYTAFLESHAFNAIYACTTKGASSYTQAHYQDNDVLLFGPETRGLPMSIIDSLPTSQRIRIPMQENSRSLNLSNSVAIITYEALRQLEFPGLN